MIDNAWLYNRKTSKVYRMCSKLFEVFNEVIDGAMKSLGYCCGMRVRQWSVCVCVCACARVCACMCVVAGCITYVQSSAFQYRTPPSPPPAVLIQPSSAVLLQ